MKIFVIICLLFGPIYGLDLTPIVKTTSGPIQGKVTDFKYVEEGLYKSIPVYQFLGIPYAKPPIGKLRLQLPVEPDSWTEVKKVTNYGPACLQPTNLLDLFKKTSEDCLFINVQVTESTFSNSSGQLRPVLVWIHGGAFTTGSGNSDTDQTPMVPLHDVILVTMNYRLGAFGFIYFGPEQKIPPNIGFQDQLLALKWVKENIEKFGGDPDRVTIFGESAGSMAVSAHVISPLSKGLFKRAILESGTVYLDHHIDTLLTDSWKLYNKTSCAKSTNVLECMQSLPANKIISSMTSKTIAFTFAVGDDFLPYEPEKVFSEGLYDNSVDLLLGVEKNDGSLFMNGIDSVTFNYLLPLPVSYRTALNFIERVFDAKSVDYFRELYGIDEKESSDRLREALEKLYTDFIFACPTYVFGHQYASTLGKQGGKVYAYYHTQRSSGYLSILPQWMGTFHGSDIPFVFGLPLIKSGYSQKDIELSREMMKIWTHFAEKGEPPKIGGSEWKPLQEDKAAMVLNIDDLGKTESQRVEFCVKEWSHFLPHVSKIKQRS